MLGVRVGQEAKVEGRDLEFCVAPLWVLKIMVNRQTNEKNLFHQVEKFMHITFHILLK